MEADVRIGGVDGLDFVDGADAAVAFTVAHEDDGSARGHLADDAVVGLDAVAHGREAGEGFEVVLQAVDAGGEGGGNPRALIHDRAVRGEGVQAALIAEIGHHGVDALDDFLGNGHLGLADGGEVHHHGAGVVHQIVEAFNALLADFDRVGRKTGRSPSENQGDGEDNRTGKFHVSLRFFELGVFTPAGAARAKRPAKIDSEYVRQGPLAFPLLRRCCNVVPAGHPHNVIRPAKPFFRHCHIHLTETLPVGCAKVKSLTCIFFPKQGLFNERWQ